MKDTLLIAFNGGAYGTYLEWVLNNMIGTGEIQEPFTIYGNSHNSNLGRHFGNTNKVLKYSQSDEQKITGRFHPKIYIEDDITTNLNSVLDVVSKMILLYPDPSHELLCVCNYMSKIWTDQNHYYDGPMHYINVNDIFDNYPLDKNIKISDIPIWIQREHMSFNLFSAWRSQVEWYFPDRWQHPRSLVVTTKELLDDFESCVYRIMTFWGRPAKRNVKELVPYHDKMMSLQQHLGKDQLCDDIIKSVLGQYPAFEWGDLCLVSQAWIQHQLRGRGYEIMCHELNDWPRNTADLSALIYKTR